MMSDYTKLSWSEERDACGVGFVAHVGGRASHDVLAHGLTALTNLAHRGAVSADGKTGDGAGVLTSIPRQLFRRELEARGVRLERDRDLAVGVFFVANDSPAERVYALVRDELARSPLETLAWRLPPLDPDALGDLARARMPDIRQVLLRRPRWQGEEAFERTLYLTRKRIERRLRDAGLGRAYVCSLSSRTVSYKGLLAGDQLQRFYLDLADPDYETPVCVFHQRFSTNTEPRWSLAQPFRLLGHNGEINTLQGNVNFMRAREPRLTGRAWGDEAKDLLPIIEHGVSDSGALDNALELLALSGRDLPHALMMLLPQAYENDPEVDDDLRGFYAYHATLMEPWDGPAALAVTDGRHALAMLDRNGLRPQRYWLTQDDLLVVASEAGVLPEEEHRVVERGRLGPGRMIAVDLLEGRLLRDAEIKERYARRRPYGTWVERYQVDLEPAAAEPGPEPEASSLRQAQAVFGYHAEERDRIFEPMAVLGEAPVGSMGDDTPLAVFSPAPQLTYRYFKQRFAQVTNPPMDPLRENVVMSLATVLGPRASVLDEEPEAARVMRFDGPIIDAAQLASLKAQSVLGAAELDCTFPVAEGAAGLARALEELADRAQDEVASGVAVLVLSDRGHGAGRAPVPMLLAVGAVHHRLLLVGRRTRAAIVCDTGEPREDHHFACLIGFGAALVHPYLALSTARDVARGAKGRDPIDPDLAVANYVTAVEKGLLKSMSKMGISTMASYRGAQVFEQIGLSADVVERYFYGTPGLTGGAGLEVLAGDALELHAAAYPEAPAALVDRGVYRFRKAGEYHSLNPEVFKPLHKAVRTGSAEAFAEYTRAVDERPPTTVRDLLDVRPAGPPLALGDVEPIDDVLRRFTTQAMSHGSVSREAHEAMAIAMNRLGGRSNSGEGGEDPARFAPFERDMPERSAADTWHPRAGDLANSAIKQVASGRFGVTAAYLVNAQEIEIKMAQGSKPGEGGQIPGFKVSEEIAAIRHSVPGVTLISPPPHHDIYSIEDLAQLIYDLKRVSPRARVGVKLVSSTGIGTIAAGVAKGYADGIQVSGHDGGTGASPLASVKHSGMPWELGLADVQRTLVENGLRGRVRLRVDGGLKTARDVVIAAAIGAEEYGFGTTALVALGCAMIRQCHLNTCPVGIATQDPELRRRFAGEPEHVVRFFTFLAESVRHELARLGARSLDDLVGRWDLLAVREGASLDVGAVFDEGALRPGRERVSTVPRNDPPAAQEPVLDDRVAEAVADWLAGGPAADAVFADRIDNGQRTVGARAAGLIAERFGGAGVTGASFTATLAGAAGQSFGAFAPAGLRLVLEGEAQDYVGKSLSGGTVVLRPRDPATRGVIAGNTVLYGATSGALFAAGSVGERVCVRNSGATAVVEGCGDHGCEYMTGGTVVVLGRTGRNFAAGMSGGVAWVLDEEGRLPDRLNRASARAERLVVSATSEEEELRALLERHVAESGSAVAARLLASWGRAREWFWRVMPLASPQLANTEAAADAEEKA